jgi:hypothetical protein
MIARSTDELLRRFVVGRMALLGRHKLTRSVLRNERINQRLRLELRATLADRMSPNCPSIHTYHIKFLLISSLSACIGWVSAGSFQRDGTIEEEEKKQKKTKRREKISSEMNISNGVTRDRTMDL